jgi:hypothetical protein
VRIGACTCARWMDGPEEVAHICVVICFVCLKYYSGLVFLAGLSESDCELLGG